MKVILAIDDSEYSQHLLDEVCRRHWPPDTQFKILRVVEPTILAEYANENWNDLIEVAHRRRQDTAHKACAELRHRLEKAIPDATVHAEVRHGDPRTEIVDSAVEWEADRILLGAHGRNVCPRFTLGSVSRSVASFAGCSVEIVRPMQHGPRTTSAPKETVHNLI